MCNKCALVLLLVSISLIASVSSVPDERDDHERRLVYNLFAKKGYNPLIRPVFNDNDSLQINFSLALSQIISLDEKNQMMKTNVWLQVYWYDYQLVWDPAHYGNIKSIRINPRDVWVPDFVLFNNADGNYEVTFKSNAVIYSGSGIGWIPPAIYQSSCSIDVRYFPFDQQICEMKFGSWTHKGKELTYNFYKGMDHLDLVAYLKSGSWDIIDCPGHIDTIRDEITGEEKQLIVFEFIVRRKTLFYTVNLIIPCVLISFVSICVFALPADAGEKITLCISVLLALVVFLLLVSKILPPSLNIPLIAKYLLFTFIMNLITIFSTVVVINRNYRTPRTHQMPYWVRVVFIRELPKYICMRRPDHEERWEGKPKVTPPRFPSTPDIRRENNVTPSTVTRSNRQNDYLELTEVHHPHCRLNTLTNNHKDNNNGRHSNWSSQTHLHHTQHIEPQYDPHYQSHSQVPPPPPPPPSYNAHLQSHQQHIMHQHQHSYPQSQSQTPPPPLRQESSESSNSTFTMTPELYKTIEAVKFIYQHMKTEEEYEIILEDWKYVARVLDRLLLIIFLVVTLAGTAGILLNAPHILEYVDQEKIINSIIERTLNNQ